MKLLVLLTVTLLASANARSLRLPEARFASLEGFAEDMYDAEAVRAPRHLADFAEFDRPLSPDAVDLSPHHRFARGATEPCDCADNPDLVGEIVETAPIEEGEEGPFCAEFAVPPHPEQPAVVYELVEAPEERAGVELTADDAQLEDDQEATLCDEGLHPEDEADVEPCAGRPARQLKVGSIQDEDSEEAQQTASEVVEGKSAAAEEVDAETSAQGEIDVSKKVKSEATEGVRAEISDDVKAETSEGLQSSEGVKVEASEGEKVEASEGEKVEASEGVKDKASERVKVEASEGVKIEASEGVKDKVSEGVKDTVREDEKVEANDGAAAVLGVPAQKDTAEPQAASKSTK
ncbi:hypothetical protein FOCC_FOCC017060 [Frankliniella occidentalis]|uniref:Neurofilament medium polypeptide-like n=1 Tax=Frankliniella occidentalis TaxID=133901 RepID=A0A6J1RZ10_FRAOC|nr:neurofilament medium polypeptide-like [Frankliniella occidentalis]KAE8737478.1 hypothetical protein FOCC_FOCC017060 [Frankliniella occidentalis]